jgi:hypothetical protein
MKKIILLLGLFYLSVTSDLFSQQASDTSFYLITCGPGTETYSVYGHSALRITIGSQSKDLIFNWGVFDFAVPNFAWKFAKGRLDYFLITEKTDSFLQSYFYEKRYVVSQKINLNSQEKKVLLDLIIENLKPENAKYRYDFFYDDCSTRIRDLLEKTIGKTLLYPPFEKDKPPTFRKMVGKYQAAYPWLNFGIDLIMGSPGDKKALFRDRMFLPIDMKEGLSEAVVNRDGKMIPLLQNPELILDFPEPRVKGNFLFSPVFLFLVLMILVFVLTGILKKEKHLKIMDLLVFSVFSILSVMMIFFNFFTDHAQMRWNLNIIWLNPFVIICLILLILNKPISIWFRIVYYLSTVFLVFQIVLPQQFNLAFIPLAVIIFVRSFVRSGFEWNPLNRK